MAPWSAAATSRLPVFITVFFLLQVQGRPYSRDLEEKTTLSCLPIHLTYPRAEYLEKLSLPEGLKSRYMLAESDYNLPLIPPRKILCAASGVGNIRRNPEEAKKFLMEYMHRSSNTLRTTHEAKIEGAGVGVLCTTRGQRCSGAAAFLFTPAQMKTLCLYKFVFLTVQCPDNAHQCYNVTLMQVKNTNNSRPRDERTAQRVSLRHILAYSNPGQSQLKSRSQLHATSLSHQWDYLNPVGLIVGVVGVLMVFFLLILCGGRGDTYKPTENKATGKRMSPSDEIAARPEDSTHETVFVQDSKTNGTSATVTITSDKDKEMTRSQDTMEVHSPSSVDHDHPSLKSADHPTASNLKDQAMEKRARGLSAPRSFDPLPEVPKLELAEENPPKARGKDEQDVGDDDDDDDPYDVVPGDNPERMLNQSDSEEEGSNNRSPEKIAMDPSQPIPYGKVSRHVQPGEQKMDEDESDSYAEVRDVVRRGPLMSRDRSHTAPLHPDEVSSSLRDKRANTESAAHMPLPQIPGGACRMIVDSDNMTYDSIPEDTVKENRDKKQPSPQKKKGERLYESVDEVGEKDLYESVPDDLTKMDLPGHLSTPTLSPTKMLESGGVTPPVPPASPIPTSKNVDVKKRSLEKTLSTTNPDEGKRRFSFFGRKKTSSVSSSKPKKGDIESPTSLPPSLLPSSPLHKSPPLPNIPAPPLPNEDYDEDTYDKVTPGLPPSDNVFQHALVDDTIAKTRSLPMAFRPGARPNLPLPRLPENSGTGTVVHKRVLEGDGGPDDYDMVHRSPMHIPDEPNYDTVHPEKIHFASPDIEVDPPYDKVDKEEFMALREKEIAARERMAAEFDPPYDRVDKDELQELRELEKARKEGETAAAAVASSSLATGYAVIRGVTPEGERGREEEEPAGPRPEHDEEGYAVVPEEFKMRKRAMSASQGLKKLRSEFSPDSLAAGYHLVEHHESDDSQGSRSQSMSASASPSRKSPRSPKSSEEQYASINMQAKRERQQRELEEALREQESLRAYMEEPPRSSSPLPPPLPPAPKPEDLEGFEERPPIPAQSAGVHQLVGEGGGLRAPQQLLDTNDPPYAKVRSKVDNPYAVVSQPYAEIDVDIQKRVSGGGAATDQLLDYAVDEAAGYNVIGTLGVKAKTVSSVKKDKPYDTVADIRGDVAGPDKLPKLETGAEPNVSSTDKPYDTIADIKEDIAKTQYKHELPMLETARYNIYDSLSPETPTKQTAEADITELQKHPPRSMV